VKKKKKLKPDGQFLAKWGGGKHWAEKASGDMCFRLHEILQEEGISS